MPIHPRNQGYKDRILSAPYEICVERARYYTESYRKTGGEHPALRAAQAFAHTLRKVTVSILEEERIVGNRSSKLVAAVIPVERGEINSVLELEIDFLTSRPRQPYRIGPGEKRELMEEIIPYWRGKTLRDRKKALWKENGLYFKPALGPVSLWRRYRGLDLAKLKEAVPLPRLSLSYLRRGIEEIAYNNPAMVMNVFDIQGHMILGHKNILREGFSGVRARALTRLEKAGKLGDKEGEAFLQAVIISCDAIRDFAARFAEKAEALAAESPDPARQEELRRIAERCRRVPFEPPRDFREAVQSLWLTQVGAFLAYGMGGIFAVGRLDQQLYPFWARDQAEGRITDGETVELLEELLIKLSYNLLLLPIAGKSTGSELGSDSCAPTVGGLDPDGQDAVNGLSYLVLDAFTNVKSLGNTFSIRLSEKSPEDFWRKALATYRETSGAALFSDEMVVEALRGSGVEERDARDYGIIGCVEPTGDGNTFGCTSGNDISLTAALEMTLLDGYLRIMGKRIGPRTGDPRKFSTFEEFLGAYQRQVAFLVETITRATDLKDQAYLEGFPNPYVSATLSGCVENARDMTAGGARYNFGSVSARGLGTVVDSLAAIKRQVYDQKLVSMERLLRALGKNFQGENKLRAQLASKGPRYGCDNDEVDAIAAELAEFFCREVAGRKTIRGGPYRPGFFSYGMHILEGLFLGATPNGRRAGEPVSNSFSPANGSERQGPTAVLRSAAKINQSLISNGCALNIKFLPAMFAGEERLEKMVSLVKSYFSFGGMEVQFNAVSNQTLIEAQKNPEKYRDLVVRVSGYSAYFADLGKPLQDEIIQRTAFGNL